MITWEGFATFVLTSCHEGAVVGLTDGLDRVFQTGLANGGPSGLVYGYIFTWIGTVFQGLVMAELASMFVDL
jgi:hypothetical protein